MADPYNGKYCKDCKWFFHKWSAFLEEITMVQCKAPIHDPVFGEESKTPVGRNAYLVRQSVECGPEGKLFEPKPKPESG